MVTDYHDKPKNQNLTLKDALLHSMVNMVNLMAMRVSTGYKQT